MRERLALALWGWAMRLATPLLLARWWWRGRQEPGYRDAMPERLGRYRVPASAGWLWLHAVSLGETRAAAPLVAALRARLERGEQSLLFLNRRGYAPVMHCDACGWISNCRRCTAFMVLHKPERRLRCHHCSLEMRVPVSCPTCGNVDLQPLGRGTQRVEEHLQALFPEARVLRIDADSTRRKGSAPC